MTHKFTLLFITLFSICSFAQKSNVLFEKTSTFYPNEEAINNEDIEWGFFTVPENWEDTNGKKIKLAVAILKNTSKSKDNNPVVMIDGGPGAGSIEGIWWWLNHPLREKSDIILVDARGTGFSEPRLCPELGNEFLKILAKNQDAAKDEEEKVFAAMACKQQLIVNGIDVSAYHSENIAKDLNALKDHLKHQNWNVYGVSYGTYVAQVYANDFPDDIKSLILDSPISDISDYYTYNTSNYISSLNKVFKACENDSACSGTYPNLENIYYKVIEELTKNPITVKVDNSIIKEGTFTYNVEDFKVAIHQALYQKRLIEVLPLLIYQFHNRNKNALSALVAAFSGALGLDYGMYYCVSCYETIPSNSIQNYNDDSNKYPKLKGGLSFYSSDFAVCKKWNNQKKNDSIKEYSISQINAPTLIFTGEFDPITPSKNGNLLASRIKNSNLINAISYGHASSFTRKGFEITNTFINAPNSKIKGEQFESNVKINFVKDVYINGGISKLGNSINNFDILFFSPLLIALIISLIAFFIYILTLARKKEKNRSNKIVKLLLIINSLLGVGTLIGFVLALNETASKNFYILAFGIPENWSYLFTLLYFFLGLIILTCLYFIFRIKKIENRSVLFSVLFSNILIGIYFLYWGFVSFI